MIRRMLYRKVLSNEVLKADFFHYTGNLSYGAFKKSFRDPGFHFTIFFRLSWMLGKYSPGGIYARIMYRKLTFKYGYQIPRATRIAGGMRISHFGNLLVNSKTIVGPNCYFSHNVTIGETKRGLKMGSPTLGNRVWLGPGVVIVGKITIGDNVLVAPNSYVNIDIPSNSIAIGNPVRIIPKHDATEGYITNCYKD